MVHIPVLSEEVIAGLALEPDDVVLDATVNEGGHSSLIAKHLSTKGTIIGIDEDAEALAEARANLRGVACTVILERDNFRNLDQVLLRHHIPSVNKVLLDIGLSSRQLDVSGRGFSFQKDEPLLMTFRSDPDTETLTAYEVVNRWKEESLADVIYGFGGERFARRIARRIVEARKIKPIERTVELAELVRQSIPRAYRFGKIHPATKTFQAIRIAVNDEFGALKEGIEKAFEHLEQGGILAVIAFHSGEDRIVKNLFRDLARLHTATIITKKPLVPSDDEVKHNPRSRSARLRIIKK